MASCLHSSFAQSIFTYPMKKFCVSSLQTETNTFCVRDTDTLKRSATVENMHQWELGTKLLQVGGVAHTSHTIIMLQNDLQSHIIVLHAFTACDKTFKVG